MSKAESLSTGQSRGQSRSFGRSHARKSQFRYPANQHEKPSRGRRRLEVLVDGQLFGPEMCLSEKVRGEDEGGWDGRQEQSRVSRYGPVWSGQKGSRAGPGPGPGQIQGLVLVRGNGDMGVPVVSRERHTNNTTHLQVHPTLGYAGCGRILTRSPPQVCGVVTDSGGVGPVFYPLPLLLLTFLLCTVPI